MSSADFISSCTIRIGKLAEAVRKNNGVTMAEAKRELDEELEGVCEEKTGEDQLERLSR
jgi:hypothetical protein